MTSAGPAGTREALARLRPDLVDGYDAALPEARAAVLARLLGALDREPLPGMIARRSTLGAVRNVTLDTSAGGRPSGSSLSLADDAGAHGGPHRGGLSVTDDAGARGGLPRWGLSVTYDAGAAAPFAISGPGLTARLTRLPAESEAAIDAVAATTDGGPVAGDRLDDPGELVRALWPGSPLATEIDNSVANLALARAANPAPSRADLRRLLADATGDPDGLGRLEQTVIDGHPLHPCCRTRTGMSVADVLAYGPEHRRVIRLRRLRVPAGRWYGDGPPVLYAHPWQAERLLAAYPWLTDDGPTEPARPLMSLRTVAPLAGGDHVKTAVDVQMTSAVRTVSPAAVHNGPRLSALLGKLAADLPLTALPEIAAGAVLIDGQPQKSLAHLIRRAPVIAPNETVLPLGADHLVAAAVTGDPHTWFAELAGILWPPLVTLLHRGVALEAHGQNTLLVLRDGRPARILYRDLGGVRVSARRLREAGAEPPDLLGDLPTDDPDELRTKLAAAALATVAAQLIAAFTRKRGADPDRLWATVTTAIHRTGTPDATRLLTDPLPLKATTAMRLAADPLADLWTPLPNPLAAYA